MARGCDVLRVQPTAESFKKLANSKKNKKQLNILADIGLTDNRIFNSKKNNNLTFLMSFHYFMKTALKHNFELQF